MITTASTQRGMIWEQAKGLLRSISASYEGSKDEFEEWHKHLEEFITDTEDNGRGGFT